MQNRREVLQSLLGAGGLGLSGLGLAGCVSKDRPTITSTNFRPTDQSSPDAGLWASAERAEVLTKRSHRRINDPKLERYLSEIVCRVAGDVCKSIRVYVMRVPAANASMHPNGMLQIWSGMLLRAQSEAQLAAIIGHEVGHFISQHSAERHEQNVNTAGFSLVLSMGLAGVGIPAGDLIYLASVAHMSGFSRDNEREADLIGIKSMHRAGYDTSEASALWQQFRAEREAKDGKHKGDIMFATHPSDEERMKTLADEAKKFKDVGARFENRFSTYIDPYKKAWLDDEIGAGSFSSLLTLLDLMEERQGVSSLTSYFRGEALRRRAKPDDNKTAIKAYRAALDMPEAPVESYRGLGLVLQRTGNADGAREALTAYVEKAPNAPDRALIRSMIKGTV